MEQTLVRTKTLKRKRGDVDEVHQCDPGLEKVYVRVVLALSLARDVSCKNLNEHDLA
jgi:hypothetical protein